MSILSVAEDSLDETDCTTQFEAWINLADFNDVISSRRNSIEELYIWIDYLVRTSLPLVVSRIIHFIVYENYDIAIAMSSSCAGIKYFILLGWMEGFKYLNHCYCPGWGYLQRRPDKLAGFVWRLLEALKISLQKRVGWVLKNLEDSLNNRHWDISIWTIGGWENCV